MSQIDKSKYLNLLFENFKYIIACKKLKDKVDIVIRNYFLRYNISQTSTLLQ